MPRTTSTRARTAPTGASCHTARGWKQIAFDHDRLTSFPLKGPHKTATCEACHIKPPKAEKPPVTCFGCHAKDDAHKGANGMDCARCHNRDRVEVGELQTTTP